MGFFDNIFSKESKTKLEFYQMENKILIGGPGAVVVVVVVVHPITLLHASIHNVQAKQLRLLHPIGCDLFDSTRAFFWKK